MNMMISTSALALSPSNAAANPSIAAPQSLDAALLAAVDHAGRVSDQWGEADSHEEKAMAAFRRNLPEPPVALNWKPEYAVWCRSFRHDQNGKTRLLCDIIYLSDKPKTWLSSAPEDIRIGIALAAKAFLDYGDIVDGLRKRHGVAEATAASAKARCDWDAALADVVAIKARTVRGMRAKAHLILHACYGGDPADLHADDTTADNRLMASIVNDLIDQPASAIAA